MIEFKKSKKRRSKSALFNPYKNGISTYDMAYLSSQKSICRDKIINIKTNSKEEYFAA